MQRVVTGGPGVVLKTVVMLIALSMLGCAVQAGSPKRGGTLTFGMTRDILTLDPHKNTALASRQVYGNIFEGLTEVTQSLEVKPRLATSWDISKDGLTYTFYLRKGVKFHNGREMTADDVVYSLKRIWDPATGSSGRNLHTKVFKDVVAVDRYTVRFHLHKPFSLTLDLLDWRSAAIVPKEIVEQDGDLSQRPIGTGPFRFDSHVSNFATVLVRNENYYEPNLPYLDKVVFRVLPEEMSRLIELQSGEADIIEAVPLQYIDEVKKNKALKVEELPSTGISYVTFNCRRPPFNDPKVRYALSLAVDRAAVVDLAVFGHGVPLAHPVPVISPYKLDVKVPERDVKKARKLLAEAGYPNGFATSVNVIGGSQPLKVAAEVLQSQFKEIGVDLKVDVTEPGIYEQKVVQDHDFDLAMTGWSQQYDPYLKMINHLESSGSYNVAGWKNPRFDALLAQGIAELDVKKRTQLYSEACQLVVDEAPWLVLWNSTVTAAYRVYVKNYSIDPQSIFLLREVWLDK